MKTTRSRESVAQLSALLASRERPVNPYRCAANALELARYGVMADRIGTDYCNGMIETEAYERKTTSLTKRVNALVAPYLLKAHVGGDPRGFCLHLFSTVKRKPLRGNTWGGDEAGYGV